MFEFEQYDPVAAGPLEHPILDAETQKRFNRDRILSYSLLSWGEHCTECAFPSCYKTCSFYQPRQDGRCRRFKFGICRTASPDSWMGYSAFVEFKNWSMLWAQGNATQIPPFITATGQFVGSLFWTLSKPIDAVIQKVTGRKRLSLVLQSLRRRIIEQVGRLYPYFPKPDCLLIEVFNPMKEEMKLYAAVSQKKKKFEWAERAQPGFSSFAIPIGEIERWIDLSQNFALRFSVAEEDQKSLYFCSATFVQLAPVAEAKSTAIGSPKKKIKCVIWDLDNTLWDGVLIEKGGVTPQLKDGIRSVIEELDRRGILLSVASKNSDADAKKALEELGLWDYFLAPQVNWGPKSTSIKRIAEKLNLGLDSFAFVDDMPFERDEVASILPTVNLVPAEEFLSILGKPEYSGDSSSKGNSRREMYKTEMARDEAMEGSDLSYDAFLSTCGIRVSIERPQDDLLPRIHDIVQRTNQLNIASQRYELADLAELIKNDGFHCYIVSCSDNYGEYGHVGFIVVELQEKGVVIRDCMFSCRIQGKRIDEAVLAHILNHYLRNGASVVRSRYVHTKRNAPAREMMERLGFAPEAGRDIPLGSEGVLALPTPSPREEVAHVAIESNLPEAFACSSF